MQNVTPTGRFILARVIEVEEPKEKTTVGGLVLSEQGPSRPTQSVARAIIEKSGPEVAYFNRGMKVLYNYFSGNQFIIPSNDPLKEDEVFHLVFEEDILATYED